MRRAPAILLLLAVLGGIAYGTFQLTSHSLDQLLGFSPAYLHAQTEAPGTAPLTPRLVILLVNDLAPAEALRLPSLEWLERQGSHWQVKAEPSSESTALATLLTGLPAERYGVYPLDQKMSLIADNFMGAARRRGLHLAAVGGEALISQTLPWLNRGSLVATGAQEAQALERIRALLTAGGPDLTVVQIPMPSPSGGRDAALAALDARIAQFIDLIDLQAMTVLVTSVSPSGRPGPRGEVPLIAAGVGIQPGAFGPAGPEDIAPTVAALLGLPPLAHAVGEPLWSGLATPPPLRESIQEQILQARHRFATALLTAFGSTANLPDPPSDATDYQPFRTRLAELEREAMRAAWLQGLIQRAPYLGGGFLLALLILIAVLTRSFGGTAVANLLLYAAGFHLWLFAIGGGYGPWLTKVYQTGAYERILIPMVGAGVLSAAVTGALLARRGITSRGYLATLSLTVLLGTVAAHSLVLAVLLVFNGWEFPLMLPGATWLAAYLLILLQLLVLSGGAPVWAILAATSGRLITRLFPVTPPTPDPEAKVDKVVRVRPIRKSTRRGVPR